MAYLVAKTSIEESTGLVSTTEAGHLALHNDKARAVNSLAEEMVDARNPTPTAPAATATSVPELLGQFKRAIVDILGEANWYDPVVASLSYVRDRFHATAGHEHTGAANEAPQIAASGLATDAVETAKIKDDAVDDTKARLRNNNALRSRNAADSADLDLIKANAGDDTEVGNTSQPTILVNRALLAVTDVDETGRTSTTESDLPNGSVTINVPGDGIIWVSVTGIVAHTRAAVGDIHTLIQLYVDGTKVQLGALQGLWELRVNDATTQRGCVGGLIPVNVSGAGSKIVKLTDDHSGSMTANEIELRMAVWYEKPQYS
jgi:hypothetical protein